MTTDLTNFAPLTNHHVRIMNRIAYVFIDAAHSTLEWIASYGYDFLFEEKPENHHLRPVFRQTISQLQPGDELIITRFSNVVQDTHHLTLLLEYCRMRGIRIISVEDRFDSKEQLFDSTSALRMIQILTALPREIHERRLMFGDSKVLHFERKPSVKKEERRRRERTVLEMYLAGHSIEIIMKKCGIKHSALYMILKRNGVKADRYPQRDRLKGKGKRKRQTKTAQSESTTS